MCHMTSFSNPLQYRQLGKSFAVVLKRNLKSTAINNKSRILFEKGKEQKDKLETILNYLAPKACMHSQFN